MKQETNLNQAVLSKAYHNHQPHRKIGGSLRVVSIIMGKSFPYIYKSN